jgi:hypothetical protein
MVRKRRVKQIASRRWGLEPPGDAGTDAGRALQPTARVLSLALRAADRWSRSCRTHAAQRPGLSGLRQPEGAPSAGPPLAPPPVPSDDSVAVM